jgi:hypothetical protein
MFPLLFPLSVYEYVRGIPKCVCTVLPRTQLRQNHPFHRYSICHIEQLSLLFHLQIIPGSVVEASMPCILLHFLSFFCVVGRLYTYDRYSSRLTPPPWQNRVLISTIILDTVYKMSVPVCALFYQTQPWIWP